jgi:DNA-binding transcriptional LysR family regulator
MGIDFDTALLRSFIVAARTGSISRAAQALGRTQPALSQKLRRLEDLVGRPLFERTPSGVALTQAGEAFLPYAERVLSLAGEALADMDRAGKLSGRCGVGLMEDLVSTSLPQELTDFARRHPDVTLELMTGGGSAMLEALEAGRIQLALCGNLHMRGTARWTWRQPLVWAARPDLDWGPGPLPLVLFSQPCSRRATVFEALERAGRPWRIAFEGTTLPAIQAAVQAGLGVSALMRTSLSPDMIVLDQLPMLADIELGLVRRAGTEGEPVLDALEGLLRNLIAPGIRH